MKSNMIPSRPFRFALVALLMAVGAGMTAVRSAQAGDIPRFDRNALFVNANGTPVYLVVDMQASSFFGVPAVVGVWTDGINVCPFAVIPSNDPTRWVWLTSGGPAGVIEFHPGQQPFATWKDNTGNSGALTTF